MAMCFETRSYKGTEYVLNAKAHIAYVKNARISKDGKMYRVAPTIDLPYDTSYNFRKCYFDTWEEAWASAIRY